MKLNKPIKKRAGRPKTLRPEPLVTLSVKIPKSLHDALIVESLRLRLSVLKGEPVTIWQKQELVAEAIRQLLSVAKL